MRKRTLNSDALLKTLLQGASEEPFRQMHVAAVQQWLNVDLPRIQNRLVDLVGRTADGRLLHLELQSTNDPLMPQRMAEYALAIMRALNEYPLQVVLFVGNDKLRMTPELRTDGMVFHYHQVDIRDLDGESLVGSQCFADNLLGLLSRLGDFGRAVHRVADRVKRMEESQRLDALEQLLLTCELRGQGDFFDEELKNMPVTHVPDFSKFAFVRKARTDGIKDVVRRQLEKRFGPLPESVTGRIAEMSDSEADKLSLDVLDARSLQDLFGDSSYDAKPR